MYSEIYGSSWHPGKGDDHSFTCALRPYSLRTDEKLKKVIRVFLHFYSCISIVQGSSLWYLHTFI
jgi:hypothetical protein